MNTFTVFAIFALAAVAVAEPPVSGSGYNYNRPSSSLGFNQGFSGSGLIGGGGYSAVPVEAQTSEGANIDPQLLSKIQQIIFEDEQRNQQSVGRYNAPSSQYGVPSSSYGVPAYNSRVVGVTFEGVRQSIPVAQYHQQNYQQGFGGYTNGGYSNTGYSNGGYSGPVPSISAPSRGYGVPF